MLELIIFILPGFFALYLLILSEKNSIKKSSADYWIFLCVGCLISGLSLYSSLLIVKVLESLITLPVGWSPFITENLYLNHPIAGKTVLLFKHYLFSFGVVWLLVKIFQNKDFVRYIDGTEATHKFLQEHVRIKSKNSVMIFLKSNKVLIGPLLDADLHKNIDDDSLTIRPILSAQRDATSGKLKVTTVNFSIKVEESGEATLQPIFEGIINNIPVGNIDYLSVFNLKAFSMYLAKDKIDWTDKESSTYKYLLMLAEMSQGEVKQ